MSDETPRHTPGVHPEPRKRSTEQLQHVVQEMQHNQETRSKTQNEGQSKAQSSGTPKPAASSLAKPQPRALLERPTVIVAKPLPRVLILHTGGTLGMDVEQSYEIDPVEGGMHLKRGTGGSYGGLRPGDMLSNLFQMVPELTSFANLDLKVVFNKDSSRVGPKEWIQIAKILDKNR